MKDVIVQRYVSEVVSFENVGNVSVFITPRKSVTMHGTFTWFRVGRVAGIDGETVLFLFMGEETSSKMGENTANKHDGRDNTVEK